MERLTGFQAYGFGLFSDWAYPSVLVCLLSLIYSANTKAYQISVSKEQKIQYLLLELLKCQVCGNNFQMVFVGVTSKNKEFL